MFDDRPREHIDTRTMTPEQAREIWPELKAYIYDPCSAILIASLLRARDDPEAKAELRAKRKAAMEAELAAKMEKPR